MVKVTLPQNATTNGGDASRGIKAKAHTLNTKAQH